MKNARMLFWVRHPHHVYVFESAMAFCQPGLGAWPFTCIYPKPDDAKMQEIEKLQPTVLYIDKSLERTSKTFAMNLSCVLNTLKRKPFIVSIQSDEEGSPEKFKPDYYFHTAIPIINQNCVYKINFLNILCQQIYEIERIQDGNPPLRYTGVDH